MAIEEGDKIPAVDLDGTEGETIPLADKAGKRLGNLVKGVVRRL